MKNIFKITVWIYILSVIAFMMALIIGFYKANTLTSHATANAACSVIKEQADYCCNCCIPT